MEGEEEDEEEEEEWLGDAKVGEGKKTEAGGGIATEANWDRGKQWRRSE